MQLGTSSISPEQTITVNVCSPAHQLIPCRHQTSVADSVTFVEGLCACSLEIVDLAGAIRTRQWLHRQTIDQSHVDIKSLSLIV